MEAMLAGERDGQDRRCERIERTEPRGKMRRQALQWCFARLLASGVVVRVKYSRTRASGVQTIVANFRPERGLRKSDDRYRCGQCVVGAVDGGFAMRLMRLLCLVRQKGRSRRK